MNRRDLLPCPFCGCQNIRLGLYRMSPALSGAKGRKPTGIHGTCCECLGCQANISTPRVGEDAELAVAERWNRRAETEAERIAGLAIKQAAALEIARRVDEQAREHGDTIIHARDVASRRRKLRESNL